VDLYYSNDHTGGAFDIHPSGTAWSAVRFFQDNDEALGLTVDLISHSPCWKDTVIFVVEDDPQNGLDHVNSARSIFLAMSPWVKHQYLSKNHYSPGSIFKTVDLILGIPPLNRYDAGATDLRDLFTSSPDYAPYKYTPIAFDGTPNATWIALTQNLDFSRPDANEVELRRGDPTLGRDSAPQAWQELELIAVSRDKHARHRSHSAVRDANAGRRFWGEISYLPVTAEGTIYACRNHGSEDRCSFF
jgi:hypothetical protein